MDSMPIRDRIVEAADRLFYERGYDHTSFSDIAAAVRISRGNFYYHFRTKDEILDAVIGHRLANTERMLAEWERAGQGPADRIRSFIRILIANRAKIMLYGCPVGTLCTELAKLDHPARGAANRLFALFRDWLRRQFERLGCGADADALAMHVLARSQGVATLAAAFRDEEFIEREADQLCAWLEACVKEARRKRPKGRRDDGRAGDRRGRGARAADGRRSRGGKGRARHPSAGRRRAIGPSGR